MRLRVAAAVGLGALAWAGAAGADQPRTQLQRQLDSIVRTWSKRLNAGDNAGVARLFALPARIVQPPFAYRFTRRGDIAAYHALGAGARPEGGRDRLSGQRAGISKTNVEPRGSLPVTQIRPPIWPTSSRQM
jgi:hypothetical protein